MSGQKNPQTASEGSATRARGQAAALAIPRPVAAVRRIADRLSRMRPGGLLSHARSFNG